MPRYIDADSFLEKYGGWYTEEGTEEGFIGTIKGLVDAQPTLSPDDLRGVGKWISNHDGSWNCSECGLRVLIYAKGNFCPNCGAKMKGAEDGTTDNP